MHWRPESGAPAVLVAQPVDAGRAGTAIRPASVLQVALLLLVVANLGRIPVFSTGARDAVVLGNDIFVLVVLASGAVAMAHARAIVLDRVALTGLVFAALGGLSTLLAVSTFGLSMFEVGVSLGYLARWLYYFAIYVVAINVLTARDATPVFAALETAVLLFAAFGIVQAAFLPNFAFMVYPGTRLYVDWDPQYHRLVSTILDPNFAGALILSVLLVQVAQLAGSVKVPLWKPVMLAIALVLTASRSSLIALVVGGGVVLLIRGVGKRALKFAGGVIVLVAIMAPKLLVYAREYNKLRLDDPSALSRIVMWLRGLRVFADHPVMGVGFNTWGFVQERYGFVRLGSASYGIEGGLLFVMVMTGVVGLAVYLTMLGFALSDARRAWRSAQVAPDHRALAVGAAAFTVALIVHSMFTNSLFLPFILEPLFVLWALSRVVQNVAAPAKP